MSFQAASLMQLSPIIPYVAYPPSSKVAHGWTLSALQTPLSPNVHGDAAQHVMIMYSSRPAIFPTLLFPPRAYVAALLIAGWDILIGAKKRHSSGQTSGDRKYALGP